MALVNTFKTLFEGSNELFQWLLLFMRQKYNQIPDEAKKKWFGRDAKQWAALYKFWINKDDELELNTFLRERLNPLERFLFKIYVTNMPEIKKARLATTGGMTASSGANVPNTSPQPANPQKDQVQATAQSSTNVTPVDPDPSQASSQASTTAATQSGNAFPMSTMLGFTEEMHGGALYIQRLVQILKEDGSDAAYQKLKDDDVFGLVITWIKQKFDSLREKSDSAIAEMVEEVARQVEAINESTEPYKGFLGECPLLGVGVSIGNISRNLGNRIRNRFGRTA